MGCRRRRGGVGNAERLNHDCLIEGGPPVWTAILLFLVAWQVMVAAIISWVDLPVFGEEKRADRADTQAGDCRRQPELYFVGLLLLYAGSSAFLRGVGRDAERVVKDIASRTCREPQRVSNPAAMMRP